MLIIIISILYLKRKEKKFRLTGSICPSTYVHPDPAKTNFLSTIEVHFFSRNFAKKNKVFGQTTNFRVAVFPFYQKLLFDTPGDIFWDTEDQLCPLNIKTKYKKINHKHIDCYYFDFHPIFLYRTTEYFYLIIKKLFTSELIKVVIRLINIRYCNTKFN